MSRKLGAIALVLAVLVCSMELKSALTGGQQHNGGTVLVANGPDPTPTGPPPKKSGNYQVGKVLANGPDPTPTGPPPRKSGN